MAKKVKRNIWAKLGQLCAILAGIFLILFGINLIIDMIELDILDDVPSGSGSMDAVLAGIIAIVCGVIVIYIEIDKFIIRSHLVRGLLWIIVAYLAFGGLFLFVAGILYILAEVLK